MKAVILAGGALRAHPSLTAACHGAALVIAADSGLRHAEALGLEPDMLVGDFDSVSPELLARYPELARQQHPRDKDQLDLELACSYAQSQGADTLIILGGLGQRIDQSLAAILHAAKLVQQGLEVRLLSGEQEVYILCETSAALWLELAPHTVFSVLSLTAQSCVSLDNAHYNLQQAWLEFGSGLGVSNYVTASPLQVQMHAGLLCLVVEYAPQ